MPTPTAIRRYVGRQSVPRANHTAAAIAASRSSRLDWTKYRRRACAAGRASGSTLGASTKYEYRKMASSQYAPIIIAVGATNPTRGPRCGRASRAMSGPIPAQMLKRVCHLSQD